MLPSFVQKCLKLIFYYLLQNKTAYLLFVLSVLAKDLGDPFGCEEKGFTCEGFKAALWNTSKQMLKHIPGKVKDE